MTVSKIKEWLYFCIKDAVLYYKNPDRCGYRFIGYGRYYWLQSHRYKTAVMNGSTLKQMESIRKIQHARCNHLKGGYGIEAIVQGKGGHSNPAYQQYAVIKHTFANGDTWINCLRCGKKWKPGHPDYEDALKFSTLNVSSSGIQFQFSDGGAKHRELTANS